MSDEKMDRSESGSPIYHHQQRERGFEFAIGDDEAIKAISSHIGNFIGEPKTIFHELVSDLVHVDIHLVEPTPARNYYTLITSGMSDGPMNVTENAEELKFAELVICLPPSWPLSEEAFKQEENYWPVRALKFLARLPHEFDTWLSYFHTVPNGDPPEPFASNTNFCCILLAPPLLFSDEFRQLRINEQKTINFFSLVPLYKEEMEFKLKYGIDPLLDRFDSNGLTELLDINRKNVCKKRLFGLIYQ